MNPKLNFNPLIQIIKKIQEIIANMLLIVNFLIGFTILENEILLNYALGGSVGYVIAVTIHTLDHALKELRKTKNH